MADLATDKPTEQAVSEQSASLVVDSTATGETAKATAMDGAGTLQAGSGLEEPEYDVNVTLADLQADPNNPLFSVKSFQELNL
jgi:ATP-dependent RNA helicase DDX19/DBP5